MQCETSLRNLQHTPDDDLAELGLFANRKNQAELEKVCSETFEQLRKSKKDFTDRALKLDQHSIIYQLTEPATRTQLRQLISSIRKSKTELFNRASALEKRYSDALACK